MKTFIEHDFAELIRNDSPAGRTYTTPSGINYPSVTAVTGLLSKDDIARWRARVGDEVADRVSAQASARGTRIHTLCEDYLRGNDMNIDMFDHDMFNTLKKHLNDIDNIHALESKLYSDHLRVAGTVDCIGEYKGNLAVIDFKTSKRVKAKEDIPGYFMQCSAYAVAFEELTRIPVNRLVIIMGVDDSDPLIFEERRDNWIKKFIQLRKQYGIETGL